jgi:HSP20 family protein
MERVMKALAPWNGMTNLRKEMNHLFDRFWGESSEEFPGFGEWIPAIDILEKDNFLVITLEIPGIDPKEVKVSIKDLVLMIQGEKKLEKEFKEERFHKMERSYGTFSRNILLPTGVDEKNVEASFKNGILTVTLPKLATAKGKQIPIKTES